MTSAHPRPSAPSRRASEPGYRSRPTSSSPVGAHSATPKATLPGGLLDRYRAGATVTALAQQFGVSFDWVAQRIIAAGARRDQLPQRRARRRPAELDSDEWLGVQLAGGAGVGDLSRRLHVTPAAVRNALRHYATRRTDRAAEAAGSSGESDPQQRFAAATGRVERATIALERARRLQASAVSELHRSGLTIPAIADRLNADEYLVENLLAAAPPPESA